MNILSECKNAKRIGISGHVRPDGDCVGSCLALYQYLQKNLKKTEIKVFLVVLDNLDVKSVFEGVRAISPPLILLHL